MTSLHQVGSRMGPRSSLFTWLTDSLSILLFSMPLAKSNLFSHLLVSVSCKSVGLHCFKKLMLQQIATQKQSLNMSVQYSFQSSCFLQGSIYGILIIFLHYKNKSETPIQPEFVYRCCTCSINDVITNFILKGIHIMLFY